MKNLLILTFLIPLFAKCQFRNNFLESYTGRVDSYDASHGIGTDMLFVSSSATDTNNIVITDTIPWLSFEYTLHPDSTFTEIWNPTQRYGYFYAGGDSIFVHDVHNSPYFREWHCGKVGAVVNEISNSPFSIYPNPVKNKIFVSASTPFNNLQLKLFNSMGLSVLEKTISQLQNKTEIDLPSLSNGIYLIKIRSQNNFFSQKIIIQN